MPIYQSSLLLHNILVGMICLNEIKFYTTGMLFGIAVSTLIVFSGIYVLLVKNKEKMQAAPSVSCAAESDTEELDDVYD